MINAVQAANIFYSIECNITDILNQISEAIIQSAKDGNRVYIYNCQGVLNARERYEIMSVLQEHGYICEFISLINNIRISW
jgi:hypothetical protein